MPFHARVNLTLRRSQSTSLKDYVKVSAQQVVLFVYYHQLCLPKVYNTLRCTVYKQVRRRLPEILQLLSFLALMIVCKFLFFSWCLCHFAYEVLYRKSLQKSIN